MLSWSRPLKGWIAGCGTATAVIDVIGLVMLAAAPGKPHDFSVGEGIFSFLLAALLILVFTCALTFIPSILVIWLSERFRIRSIFFYGCVGAAIGVLGRILILRPTGLSLDAVDWIFLVAGFAAGAAYWHVAGKHTGGDRASTSCPVRGQSC